MLCAPTTDLPLASHIRLQGLRVVVVFFVVFFFLGFSPHKSDDFII